VTGSAAWYTSTNPSGFFLIQRGWTRREGMEQKYLQVIGYDRMPGSEHADAITGRLYTSNGDALIYVCPQ
jgi:hypothetical protein